MGLGYDDPGLGIPMKERLSVTQAGEYNTSL